MDSQGKEKTTGNDFLNVAFFRAVEWITGSERFWERLWIRMVDYLGEF